MTVNARVVSVAVAEDRARVVAHPVCEGHLVDPLHRGKTGQSCQRHDSTDQAECGTYPNYVYETRHGHGAESHSRHLAYFHRTENSSEVVVRYQVLDDGEVVDVDDRIGQADESHDREHGREVRVQGDDQQRSPPRQYGEAEIPRES